MSQPFRIALIMQGDQRWMGGMEYIRNIILALASLPRELRETFEVSLVSGAAPDRDFIESVRPYLKENIVLDADRPAMMARFKDAIVRRILRRNVQACDAIVNEDDFDFIYPFMDVRNPQKAATWIYDFQHKYLPEFFSPEEIKSRDEAFAQMARKSSVIVLSSKTAEADFKKYYPGAFARTRILSFKIVPQPSWYEGEPRKVQRTYRAPDKYFIVSNQFWQHKNHLAVFHALEFLNKRGIHASVVCTGHLDDYRKPEYSDIILQTIHKLGLAKQIYLLGLIPKIDQIQLLRCSIAVIQPSLFEGWSTVVEDARCLGKPLILSDLPVHLEQNPPNSRFFERTSVESLAQAMAEVWEALSPGPNPEMESIARNTNKKEVIEFAQKFLSIARSVKDVQ